MNGNDFERRWHVRYQYGTYSGERIVYAETEDAAIAAVKRELRPHMSLGMAHESYVAREDLNGA